MSNIEKDYLSSVHQDAVPFANTYAGKRVNVVKALKDIHSDTYKKLIIQECKQEYVKIYNAFMAGVDYARSVE